MIDASSQLKTASISDVKILTHHFLTKNNRATINTAHRSSDRWAVLRYTVIAAMYLMSTSCPTAVRSARAYIAVRTGIIFLIILGFFVKKGSSFSVLPQFQNNLNQLNLV